MLQSCWEFLDFTVQFPSVKLVLHLSTTSLNSPPLWTENFCTTDMMPPAFWSLLTLCPLWLQKCLRLAPVWRGARPNIFNEYTYIQSFRCFLPHLMFVFLHSSRISPFVCYMLYVFVSMNLLTGSSPFYHQQICRRPNSLIQRTVNTHSSLPITSTRSSANSQTSLGFPKSRSALWDGTPAGEKLRLQLCSHR